MIVVEGGSRFMDSEVGITVTRVLQTVAGPHDLRPAARGRLTRLMDR